MLSTQLSPTLNEPPVAPKAQALSWRKDVTILLAVATLWFCALLGLRPLGNPDEGRYTEIPREMAATGDFVTPRLNGVKYFEKPPLVYWLSALTFRAFGVNEFTARIWGGLFAVAGVLLTYVAGRVIYGRQTGIWSAVILATTVYYYALSQIILLDMVVSVAMAGSLFTFILAMRELPGKRRRWMFVGFYIFMALATLSKGLIGIAIPGAVIFLWVLLLNRWRTLWPFYPVMGTLVLLAIAGPWHVLAARANPDFLNFYFVHEHWLRFTTQIHERNEPWWFFLPVFIGGLMPWAFFLPSAWHRSFSGGWKQRHEHAEAWFFLIWIVFVIAFFSKSQSKLVPYILPVFPAAAVLLARALSTLWNGQPARGFKISTWSFIGTAALLAVAACIVPGPKKQPDLSAALPALRKILGSFMLLGFSIAMLGLRRCQTRLVLAAVLVSSSGFLLVTNIGSRFVDKTSTHKLAAVLKPMLKPEDRIYSVGAYTQDLPVYLDRLISVVDYRGELSYGIDAEPNLTSKRFFAREDFTAEWDRPGDAYAVVRKNTYDAWFSGSRIPHEVIARTDRFILVSKPKESAPALPRS